MIKDVTLGQYFPADTVVHRLDPRTKLLLVLLYIVTLFLAKWVFSYALVLCYLILAVVLARAKPAVMLRGVKPLIFIIILTGVLNVFFARGETLLFEWKFIHVYAEGIQNAVFMVLRILMLICGTFLLTYSTSPIDLTDGMERLLNPLKKLKFPVHELAMMTSIALRFIPTLIEETNKIIAAQKARGADFESGNLIRRAKALVPILVPLFISAFRRADELATAMECRCYHGGEGRTRMKQLHMRAPDWWALSISVILLASVIALRIYGL